MKRSLFAVPCLALGASCGGGGHGGSSADQAPGDGGTISQDLDGIQVFPADNPWNQDISQAPIDPLSDRYLASIGRDVGLHPDFGSFTGYGIPYAVVSASQPAVPITFDYADESDPGPYPIPDDVPIEGGADADGDRHVLVVDRDNLLLYEVFAAYPVVGGWHGGSGAIFNLMSNELRPAGFTSADAAGLPILPGLVRADEVLDRHEIGHALRFTVARMQRGYVSRLVLHPRTATCRCHPWGCGCGSGPTMISSFPTIAR
ncbi:MAG: hypothetical protein U1E76_00125 [Planctomycetota bacterium]